MIIKGDRFVAPHLIINNNKKGIIIISKIILKRNYNYNCIKKELKTITILHTVAVFLVAGFFLVASHPSL